MEKTASQIQKERIKELETKADALITKCDVATLNSINEKGYPRTCVLSIAKTDGFSDVYFVTSKAIWCCLMLSMCTENFFLAFGNSVWIWCFGAALGWIAIPWMNANLDAINRLNIPVDIQGRVFAARNSFQFFTIPVGYFLGGLLVDQVFEPIMAMQETDGLLVKLFDYGKGSGAAFLFAVLWLAGIGVCLIFRADKHIWKLEKK